MAQAGTVWIDVRGDTKGFLADVNAAARQAGSSFSPLNAGKTVLGDIGQLAGVAALGVAGLGAAAIKTNTEFSASMSGVGAVAGATASEMDALREAALDAGAATVFSASEAAVAEAELVKAGVSVADVLGGALTGSLNLAAAGQLELGKAAEIAAQAMNIFKLEGDDVGYVADVLAAGANKSAADVNQLGEALRQGGLLASQTGISLEETIGTFSLFADNALIGSDAGTSFKTMLQRLVPATGPAQQAMDDIGLSFFNAQGEFVGLEEAARRIQVSMKDLTEEERSFAMNKIFGSDAVRAANVLFEAGAEGIREYTDAVADEGAATRMAAEQLNNLKGDLEEFNGATETALIRVGELFDGMLRASTQGATAFVNVFNDFASTPAWDAIQGNIQRLSLNAGNLFGDLSDRLEAFLGGISAGEVDRAFQRVEGAVFRTREAVEGLEPVIGGLSVAFSTMALRSLPFLNMIVPAISPITGLLGGLVLGSERGRDALAQLGGEASDLASSVGPDLLRAISDLTGELSDGLASVLEDVGGAAIDAAETLGPVLGEAIQELAPVIGDLIEAGGELVAEVLPLLADMAGAVLPPAIDVLGAGLNLAAGAAELLADNVWLLVPALGAFAAVKYSDQIGSIGSAFTTAGDNARFMWQSLGDVAATNGVSRMQALREVTKQSGREVGGLASGLAAGLNPAVIGVTAAITAGVGVYQAWHTNTERVKNETKALTEALIAQGDETLPALARQYQTILETRDSFDTSFAKTGLSVSAVTEAINANVGQMDAFRDAWDSSGERVEKFREEGEKVPEGIRPIVDTLFALNEAGALTDHELREVIDGMTDLDKNAMGTAESVGFLAEQLGNALSDEGISLAGSALEDFNKAMDDNAPLDERRDALARVTGQYQDVAARAGVAVGEVSDSTDDLAAEAARAAGEIRGLIDQLDELAGVERDVDEAQRRMTQSVAEALRAFESNGNGINVNTEAGSRNADAIQRMVEAGENLAATLARTDTSGKAAHEAYNTLLRDLHAMKEAELITGEEYQRLLDLYELTPEDIETKIDADTSRAKAEIEDIRRQIRDIEGVTEPQKTFLEAALDAGSVRDVIAFLDAMSQPRTVTIKPRYEQGAPFFGFTGLSAPARPFDFGSFTGKKRASGGPVWPGTWLVGEEGPELLNIPTGVTGNVTNARETERTLDDAKAPAGGEFSAALLDEFRAMRSELVAVARAPKANVNYNQVERAPDPDDVSRKLNRVRIGAY